MFMMWCAINPFMYAYLYSAFYCWVQFVVILGNLVLLTLKCRL